MVRRNTCFIPEKSFLAGCLSNPRFHLCKGDITDPYSLERLMKEIHPDWFFNAAAQSDVAESWQYPIHTVDATAKGALHALEVIRTTVPYCKFLQFSSSELFGMAKECPQNESTPFQPRSPYGVAKLFAHWMTVNYRDTYDLWACCAILFNMESPRRGSGFVTQKIAQGVARIATQLELGETITPLKLGNLSAERDWNDARRSMRCVQAIMTKQNASDYVIGSGRTHSVREFLETALNAAGIDWRKQGDDYFSVEGKMIVTTDKDFIRPSEVRLLKADSRKAQEELSYQPAEQDFAALVEEMVHAAMPKVADGVLQ